MEHHEQSPSPEYVERFNQGYLIAKHRPELAKDLDKALENEGFDGFKAGMNQFSLEQKQQNRYGWLSAERSLEDNNTREDKTLDDLDKD